MGTCGSMVSVEDRNAVQIDEQLRKELTRPMAIKLLLLGPGECGKSTILKQMQILHKNGFSKKEIEEKKSIIYSNTVTSMAAILRAMTKLDIEFNTDINTQSYVQIVFDTIQKGEDKDPFSPQLTEALRILWADSSVLSCVARRIEYQLNDSADYFLNGLDRIASKDYIPNEQDILRSRVATLGVVEVRFEIEGKDFRVFDVGGQRSERRKWIHCFDDVHAVTFIAAISEFDQKLVEDDNSNRMVETLNLFSWVCNSPVFVLTSMILFLNKKDLFETKIKMHGGRAFLAAFPDYEGPIDYDSCVDHVSDKFLELDQQNHSVYVHQTCATDTDQVQVVLNSVIDILISKNLSTSGIS